jgi:hypothetical protein
LEPARPLEKQRLIARRVYLLFACTAVLLSAIATMHTNLDSDPAFRDYWGSGRAATAGLNPYVTYPLIHRQHYMGTELTAEGNLNPPIILPVFQVTSHRSLRAFSYTWTLLSFLLLTACVVILMTTQPYMQTRQVLWLMLCAPTLTTLGEGQIYFLLFALAVLALISLQRGRLLLAAIAIGLLVAIKPIFVLWPVLLLFSDWRIAIRSFVSAFIFSVLPLPFYGLTVYREWASALAGDSHWIAPVNIALVAYARRLDHPSLGAAAAFLFFIATATWARRTRPDALQASAVMLCASVLCSPLAWPGYLLPAAPFLVARRWGTLETIGAGLLMTSISFVGDLARLPNKTAAAALSPLPYIAGIIILMWAFSRPDLAENPHPSEKLALSEAIG